MRKSKICKCDWVLNAKNFVERDSEQELVAGVLMKSLVDSRELREKTFLLCRHLLRLMTIKKGQ